MMLPTDTSWSWTNNLRFKVQSLSNEQLLTFLRILTWVCWTATCGCVCRGLPSLRASAVARSSCREALDGRELFRCAPFAAHRLAGGNPTIGRRYRGRLKDSRNWWRLASAEISCTFVRREENWFSKIWARVQYFVMILLILTNKIKSSTFTNE